MAWVRSLKWFSVPFLFRIHTCWPSMGQSCLVTPEWDVLAHYPFVSISESLRLILEAVTELLHFDLHLWEVLSPAAPPPPHPPSLALSWTQLHALLTLLSTFGSSRPSAVTAPCDVSGMWLEWIYCIRWISFFHSLLWEISGHWVSFWEFIAICWWHVRDHSPHLTNSQMEANSLFWPPKPKILLISSLDKKYLFMLMCSDYRQVNLIFCVGKIRIGLFERFVLLNSFMIAYNMCILRHVYVFLCVKL